MTDEKRKPSSPEDIKAALTGGVPLGRWKEGLLFEGIEPTPGLKSAANWFHRRSSSRWARPGGGGWPTRRR